VANDNAVAEAFLQRHPAPVGKQWRKQPPAQQGTYWWRRSYQWEDVQRTINQDRMIYSERYCQLVPAEKLGGEWLY